MIGTAHFILYVSDQAASTNFYSKVLAMDPRLNVPGMTEFKVSPSAVLGLMPRSGAEMLLSMQAADGRSLKAELYLVVDDPAAYHGRAVESGAVEISPVGPRDWGHTAGYSVDPDGNVIAFASEG